MQEGDDRRGERRRLDEADPVADVESVLVSGEADEGLLLAVGSDQSADRLALNVVQLLDRARNLALVRPSVHNEDERVDLLNLLHRALRVQGEKDGLVGVHPGRVWDALARVLGRPWETESVGAVEGNGVADLADLGAGGALEGGLLGSSRLGGRCLLLACSSGCHLADLEQLGLEGSCEHYVRALPPYKD